MSGILPSAMFMIISFTTRCSKNFKSSAVKVLPSGSLAGCLGSSSFVSSMGTTGAAIAAGSTGVTGSAITGAVTGGVVSVGDGLTGTGSTTVSAGTASVGDVGRENLAGTSSATS